MGLGPSKGLGLLPTSGDPGVIKYTAYFCGHDDHIFIPLALSWRQELDDYTE
jgi:hypothetical protein